LEEVGEEGEGEAGEVVDEVGLGAEEGEGDVVGEEEVTRQYETMASS
jgi:hypothetical protein